MINRHTLAAPVVSAGIGLHTGERVRLAMQPASAGSGIVFIRSDVTIMGETKGTRSAKYIHGTLGQGQWTYYGGHDPEDYRHLVNDPPTDLNLHPNSAGYRLILNNILFPAARKKERKT